MLIVIFVVSVLFIHEAKQRYCMSTSELSFSAVSGNGLILKIDLHNLKKAALVLRAVNHKLRQQILKLIDEHIFGDETRHPILLDFLRADLNCAGRYVAKRLPSSIDQ